MIKANVAELGKLMVESHESLRDDFEVSCRELDLMFELALVQGGCTINLVEREKLVRFIEHMTEGYQQATSLCQ